MGAISEFKVIWRLRDRACRYTMSKIRNFLDAPKGAKLCEKGLDDISLDFE